MLLRIALATALAALIACPAAVAHGGGAERGYRSTVVRVTPSISGLDVRVVDGDDQLELTNTGGREVIVEGYEEEPYLRFTREGVFENQRSPAAYLNDDRFANVTVPDSADPKAEPEWKAVAAGVSYAWHDHRVHWMSPALPPKVEAAKDVEHHIFDWEVPGTVDGEPLAIDGSLDYVPPKDTFPVGVLLGVGAASVLLFAGVLWFGLRWRRNQA
jgi:hypothetical protein